MSEKLTEQKWVIYILLCNDDTLYTGITNDIENRLTQHETGAGAKYTKGRGPFRIVYQEGAPDRSTASKREYEIKKMTKSQKLKMIKV